MAYYPLQHQVITWTDVDLFSQMFCGIRLRGISQDVYMDLIHDMFSEITLLQ